MHSCIYILHSLIIGTNYKQLHFQIGRQGIRVLNQHWWEGEKLLLTLHSVILAKEWDCVGKVLCRNASVVLKVEQQCFDCLNQVLFHQNILHHLQSFNHTWSLHFAILVMTMLRKMQALLIPILKAWQRAVVRELCNLHSHSAHLITVNPFGPGSIHLYSQHLRGRSRWINEFKAT